MWEKISRTSKLLCINCQLGGARAKTNCGGDSGTGGAMTKKFILWFLVLLQTCFIACFWLLQFSANKLNVNELQPDVAAVVVSTRALSISKAENQAIQRVNFITQKSSITPQKRISPKMMHLKRNATIPSANATNICNFTKDFYQHKKSNRLIMNVTEAESAMAPADTPTQLIWCFREGTRNESNVQMAVEDEIDDVEQQCTCDPEWHGKDCGQPEIIWRALMTARRPFKLQQPCSGQAASHRIILLLEGNFFSLDLLELQIKAVAEVVDYFIIFCKHSKASRKESKALQHHIKDLLVKGNYFLFHCDRVDVHNCTAAQAYKKFQHLVRSQQLTALSPPPKATDLFVYTQDYEILSARALKFLKYYATEVQFVRFRLKFNVYGFYWQHPEQTHLTAVISSFMHLDQPQVGNCDPMLLLRKAMEQDSGALIIGDLNHFGGWFCKYCQQPDEIIAQLNSSHLVRFPNDSSRTHAGGGGHIDAAYLQTTIANGLYVDDAETKLLRLRANRDKYYAPAYAQALTWKFGNLLVNLYENELDDDIDEAY